MSKKLSPGAVNLLEVINRAPGHSRGEIMKLAGISRRVWSNLSGELKANGMIRAESSTVIKGKKNNIVYLWYSENQTSQKKVAKPKKSPKASAKVKSHVRRGTRKPSSSWSATEVRLLKKLWKEGKTDKQIAAAFKKDSHCGNRTVGAISKRRQEERLFKSKQKQIKSKAGIKVLKNAQKSVEPKTVAVEEVVETVSISKQGGGELETIKTPAYHLERAMEAMQIKHQHNEYAHHVDVQNSFDAVAKTVDELNTTITELNDRMKVVEETLAGMQDNQATVDREQSRTLRDALKRMTDFTTEVTDILNNDN